MSINDYGQKLLYLCTAPKLRILNDRARGDLQGHICYIGQKGRSIVDTILTCEICLLEEYLILYF